MLEMTEGNGLMSLDPKYNVNVSAKTFPVKLKVILCQIQFLIVKKRLVISFWLQSSKTTTL